MGGRGVQTGSATPPSIGHRPRWRGGIGFGGEGAAVIVRARNAIFSLDILADGAQRQLRKLPDGGECELLHGHILEYFRLKSCHNS